MKDLFKGIKVGVRNNKRNWKYFIFPKVVITPDKNHPYIRYGIWWLNFSLYIKRKCSICGNYISNRAINLGHNIICNRCETELDIHYINYKKIVINHNHPVFQKR